MLTKQFDYFLPKKLIAQHPIRPRDRSRLLVLNRKTGAIQHRNFYELGQFLQPGDVLVLNNTKVFPARLIGKKPTGGKMEILLLWLSQGAAESRFVIPAKAGIQQISQKVDRIDSRFRGNDSFEMTSLQPNKNNCWQVLLGGRDARVGLTIKLTERLTAQLIKKLPNNIWLVKFNQTGKKFDCLIDQIGQPPTPPYIKQITNNQQQITANKRQLTRDYQTIFAKYRGSVAAPTAGLHFTKGLIQQLKKQGVQFEFITLHVGYGTFQPVKTKTVEAHQMHPEYAELNQAVAQRLNQAKREGRRIIAVGTTTVRVLESLTNKKTGYLRPATGYLNAFIYPGYHFQFIDALITNFHLPQSTLLMLTAAFAGRKLILQTYQKAIKKKYRFYSFGDAMLIM